LSDAPPIMPIQDRPSAATADFQGQTPPPFGDGSSTSGHSLQPLHGQPQTVVVVGKRSLVWPLLAIAMVGIAAGALFLVWKQTQAQPPPVVNITTEKREDPPLPDPLPDPSPGSGEAGSAAVAKAALPSEAPTGSGDKKPAIKRPPANPYNAVVQAQRGKVLQCGRDHGAPPANAKMVITVGTNGKTKNVSFEPTSLNGTPLGACIKNVLASARFPTADADRIVSVELKAS
jgi:hypothetical protein